MKKKILFIVTAILALAITLTACGDKEISGLSFVDGTMKYEYEVGSTPDFSGVRATVKYNDGSTKEVGANELKFSSLDTSTPGVKKLAVTYDNFTLTVDVNVKAKSIDNNNNKPAATLTGIEVVKTSVVNKIKIGETLATDSLQVAATYSDTSVKIINASDLTIGTIDSATAGEKKLSVSYGGFTAELTITVVGVKNMAVINSTINSTIPVGGTLDTSTLQVSVTYTDDTTETLSKGALTLGTIDTSAYGDKQLSITFLDKTITYKIHVRGLISIAYIDGIPSTVYYGGTLNTNDVRVLAKYSDGEVFLTKSDLEISALDTALIGKTSITLTYGDKTASVPVEVLGVSSMSVITDSIANKVAQGGVLATSGLKLNVTYTDGSSEQVSGAAITVGAADTSTFGDKQLSITYLDKTINYSYHVKGISGIEINLGSYESKILYGESFNLDSLTVSAIYSDGSAPAHILRSELTVDTSALNNLTPGEQTFTVSYAGYSKTATVEVVGVSSMTISGFNAELIVGNTFSASGIIANVTYTDGTTATVNADALTFDESTVDTATKGDKALAVTYLDKTVNATVKVYGVESIRLAGSVNTQTPAGVVPSLDGLVVYAVYGNGYETLVTTYTTDINDIDWNEVSDKNLTVTYAAEGSEFTATLTFSETAPLLESITFTANATVKINHAYNTESIKVVAHYGNGTSADITEGYTVSTIDTTEAGVKTLTVTYEGKSATKEITVLGVKSVAIVSSSVASKVEIGDTLDLSALSVIVTYADDSSETLGKDNVTVNNIDTATAGDKNLTVTYEGVTSAAIKVHVRAIDTVEIVGLAASVKIGKTFSTEGVTVKVTYTDGTSAAKALADAEITSNVSTAAEGNSTFAIKYTERGVTKTASKTVAVIGIESVSISGIYQGYYVDLGGTFDNTTLHVTVTYKDSTSEVVTDYSVVQTINTAVGGDQKYQVSYLGVVSAEATVHVRTITAVEIIDGTIPKYVSPTDTPSGEVAVKVTYSNGTGIVYVPMNLTTEGNVITVTVTYGGFSDSQNVTILQRVAMSIISTSIPNTIELGATFPVNALQILVTYSDGENEINEIVYKFVDGVVNEHIIVNTIDSSTTGDKALEVTYYGITRTIGVHVKGIQSLTLEHGTLQTTINKGQEINTSAVKLLAIFTDGSMRYLTIDDGLQFSGVDINATGEQTLTISYGTDYTTVKIEVVEITVQGTIYGVSLPVSLTTRDSYMKNFLKNSKGAATDSDTIYIVGDDNPFVFKLNLMVLDENYKLVTSTTAYTGKSTVHLVDGATETLVGEEYVTISESANSFQFTEAAVGKIFKITTRPASTSESMNRSLVVQVVDGYNVYSAKELNMMTNSSENVGTTGTAQKTMVQEFLTNNGFVWRDVAGLVLHGNIDIKPGDLPQGYFLKDTGSKEADGTIWDLFSVYNHLLTPENPSFTMYGNYYTIYSYNLPCVAPKGFGDNDDGVSNSQLFMLETAPATADAVGFDFKGYSSNFVNLGMRDNDPNSNDQTASERHMRGLIGIKTRHNVVNISNTVIEAYFISYMADFQHTTVNLDYAKFYNAWQGHVFIWSRNEIYWDRDMENVSPKDDPLYQSVIVNITNSELTKCGGPVIMSQVADPNYACSELGGAAVNIDEASDIHTYVTGQEAWFVAYGKTQMATQIVALSTIIEMASGNSASFVSNQKISGVDTINFMMLTMPGGLDFTGDEIDGSTTIGDKKVVNLDDSNFTDAATKYVTEQAMAGRDPSTVGTEEIMQALMYDAIANGSQKYGLDPNGNYMLDMILSQPGANQAPIFQTSEGGTAYFDGSNYNHLTDPTLNFTGEYVTLYYLGMGLLLEFYNSTNP